MITMVQAPMKSFLGQGNKYEQFERNLYEFNKFVNSFVSEQVGEEFMSTAMSAEVIKHN